MIGGFYKTAAIDVYKRQMLFLSIVDDKSNTNILNFNLLEVSNHTKATFFP